VSLPKRLIVALAALLLLPGPAQSLRAQQQVTVELQEPVVTPAPANNGAGPLWCYGAPLVVRSGERVFVSIVETLPNVPPLCNTRWQLWERTSDGWKVVAQDRQQRQREPCPIALLPPSRLFLSANPSLEPVGTRYGRCRPTVYAFDLDSLGEPVAVELPAWEGRPTFTDHSYRGFAADRLRGELLVLNIDARTSEQFVSYRDARGRWHARGKIRFPIRACYPQVALRAGRACVLAIGDIVEPVAAWRAAKREVLKREWDYVFRRLFFTWTDDVARKPFAPPIELDSAERTCGFIRNLDLYLETDGTAHVLYTKRLFQYPFLRDRFFQGEPNVETLEYAVLRGGKLLQRRTLVRYVEGSQGLRVDYARLHVDRAGRLYVLAAATAFAPGSAVSGNYWALVTARDGPLRLHPLPFPRPFTVFFTNTPRGGSEPSDVIDVFGIVSGGGATLWYGRARIVRRNRSR